MRDLANIGNFQSKSFAICHILNKHIGWTNDCNHAVRQASNPAPDFWNWREHLSNLAHDFQLGHRYDRLAMRAVDTRRYAGQPSLTSTEEQTRNGNITQHSREMLGWLWQQIHIMSRYVTQ